MKIKNIKIYSTPSQTVGPFFGNYLKFGRLDNLINVNTKIKFTNYVLCNIKNRNNEIIKDGFIEYWQSKKEKNNKIIFYNFNRIKFNKKNNCFLIKCDNNLLKNALYITIFARGLLNHLHSLVYIDSYKNFNQENILKNFSYDRKQTLLSKFIGIKNNINQYKHTIFLNGKNETIFFQAAEGKYERKK